MPSPKKPKVSRDQNREFGIENRSTQPPAVYKEDVQTDGNAYLKSLLSKSIVPTVDLASHSYRSASIRQQRVIVHIPQLQKTNQTQLSQDEIREIERLKQEEAKGAWERKMYLAWKSSISEEAIDCFVRKRCNLYDFSW